MEVFVRAASQKGTLTDELKWLFLTAMENVFVFFFLDDMSRNIKHTTD